MDVFPDMTFNDIKALVQDEINVPPASQHFFFNQQPIVDTNQTLTQVGIGEGDMLGMAVEDPEEGVRRGQRSAQQSSSQQGPLRTERPDPERMRLHIVGDPRMMAEVRERDPELAEAANDRDRFHTLWNQRQRQGAQAEAEKNAQLALLNADPFNAEAQRKIEEMIQHERIQENIQKALEETPECELDTRACERWPHCSLPCICLVS
jgi:DNA damage-inducible protein 1